MNATRIHNRYYGPARIEWGPNPDYGTDRELAPVDRERPYIVRLYEADDVTVADRRGCRTAAQAERVAGRMARWWARTR